MRCSWRPFTELGSIWHCTKVKQCNAELPGASGNSRNALLAGMKCLQVELLSRFVIFYPYIDTGLCLALVADEHQLQTDVNVATLLIMLLFCFVFFLSKTTDQHLNKLTEL